MIVNQSCPDELWAKIVEYDKVNPFKGLLDMFKRFSFIRKGERAIIVHGEERQRLEELYGKPVEDLGHFLSWLEGMKNLKLEDTFLTIREGQRKFIQGQADHYKVPFAVKAREYGQDALDKLLGNY